MAAVRMDFVEGMKKQSYEYFWEKYDMLKPVAPKVFRQKPSTASYEQWTSIVSLGTLSEKTSETQDAPVSDTTEGWTIVAKVRTYHQRAIYSKETVADHQRIDQLVETHTKQWAQSGVFTKKKFYADFFNCGGVTTGRDAIFDNTIPGVVADASGDGVYDGTAASIVPFFNLSTATRTSKGGGTYYNSLGAVALNSSNLETALILLEVTNAKTERDQNMKQVADTLLVPVNLERTALKLMKSEQEPETDLNAINPYAGRLEVVPWRFLTDTNGWFISVAKEGIVSVERQEPEIRMFVDERSRNVEAVIDVRFGGAVENFRPWIAANISTS